MLLRVAAGNEFKNFRVTATTEVRNSSLEISCFLKYFITTSAIMEASPNSETTPLLVHHRLSVSESECAIARFCQFLQFPTVSSMAATDGTYQACANWLHQELINATKYDGTPVFDEVFLLPEAPSHSPVVIALWKGADASLPILLLNSHYDVVPAADADWTAAPPFSGQRSKGNIYGRGAQDMKCVCMQYIEAIVKIQSLYPQFVPKRNIYLSFVPDEEVGGGGMAAFLESALYKNLPGGIGLALDEGLASSSEVFSLFYGERLPWWVNVTATGPTGHGSRFIEHTAVEQLVALANRALEFRQGQRSLLGMTTHENCTHAVAAKNAKSGNTTLGDVTSLNITTLEAGVRVGDTFAYNCVPPIAKCSLDIRISPHTSPSNIGAMLDQWCIECSSSSTAGETSGPPSMSWNYIGGHGNDLQKHALTSIDAKENPWYKVFENAMQSMDLQLEAQVFPAATDSRFLRALGIRAFGFSPMRNTEILLHENNEYIPESTFIEGISVYVTLIMALGSYDDQIDR